MAKPSWVDDFGALGLAVKTARAMETIVKHLDDGRRTFPTWLVAEPGEGQRRFSVCLANAREMVKAGKPQLAIEGLLHCPEEYEVLVTVVEGGFR